MNSLRITSLLFLLNGGIATGAPLQEIVEKIFPLSPNAAISIRNTDGTIYIYGSEVPELKVYARKKAYSKERLDGIAINVSIDGEKATIDTAFPPKPEGLSLKDRSGTVDYMILVPQTCALPQVELVTGEIIVSGLRGPTVNARLTNGIIWTLNSFSALDLRVAEGAIGVVYEWWETGPLALRAELKQGDINVVLPPDPSVRLDAESPNGWIKNQFGEERGQSDGRNLVTTIGGDGGAEFKIRTSNGNIRIDRGY
jgi:hypothetical protein